MRVIKEPEERKQEILKTAIRVFARKGYEKTSISDIAREMNISQGLCYRYFASKEEIYDAALEIYAEDIVAKHMQKWEFEGKTIEQIIATYCGAMDDYVEVEHGNDELFQLFHGGANSKKMHDQLSLTVGNKLIPHVGKVLEMAKQKGELELEDAYATAHFIVFGQIGILINDAIPENQKKKMIYHTLMEFLKGIKKS